MRKLKFFIDIDKEEIWLNEMAKQGYQLTRKRLGYQFQQAQPENSVIKIDYRTFKRREDFEDYCALFEDSGWKHTTGTKSSGYQYFKNINENQNEDIFSDADSKAGRYKRLSQMWITMATTFLPLFVVLMTTDSIKLSPIWNLKSLYYTPGLWEKTGASFLSAFLFETPFAIIRGFLWLFFPVLIVLYLIFAYRANRQYQKTNEGK